VLDVTPVSNVRTGAVRSLDEHPLAELVRVGVRCSVSTDDPAMFDTDLTREYEAAQALGLEPRSLYEAALAGALCDEETRAGLAAVGEAFEWESSAAEAS
jgi:aminodeoxyfutalosine deaminase